MQPSTPKRSKGDWSTTQQRRSYSTPSALIFGSPEDTPASSSSFASSSSTGTTPNTSPQRPSQLPKSPSSPTPSRRGLRGKLASLTLGAAERVRSISGRIDDREPPVYAPPAQPLANPQESLMGWMVERNNGGTRPQQRHPPPRLDTSNYGVSAISNNGLLTPEQTPESSPIQPIHRAKGRTTSYYQTQPFKYTSSLREDPFIDRNRNRIKEVQELDFEEFNNSEDDFCLSETDVHSEFSSSADSTSSQCHKALRIPEILYNILSHVEADVQVPHEPPPQRRRPLSLRHAFLIYGDREKAHQAWERALKEEQTPTQQMFKGDGALHGCLLVNKFWFEVSRKLLYNKLHFCDSQKWRQFVHMSSDTGSPEDLITWSRSSHHRSLSRSTGQPNLHQLANGEAEMNDYFDTPTKLFVLHKISNAQQSEIDLLQHKIGGALEWLEFYTCAAIVPPLGLLAGGSLQKIVLPGCTKVDDAFLKLVAENCPRLQIADLRACEKVSNEGLVALAGKCPQLKLLNVGRTQMGHLISYRGISAIARKTQVNTLGAAGCFVCDKSMWELAWYRGHSLDRLSLNGCTLLTNDSIPRILPYTSNLAVLELRGCTQITDFKSIIKFKRYQERHKREPLIEGCEIFESRMREAEFQLEMDISREILRDCVQWIYAPDHDQESVRVKRKKVVPNFASTSRLSFIPHGSDAARKLAATSTRVESSSRHHSSRPSH
ncbi:YALI0E04356p [Yarrowia lipolytica CLIB122]|uniref:Antagonist of mitotic exit network protein 1 n=2 Tax=Yarrowia lipolytica TaxID=4952 RepID=AMN1_YARLI|nr:YALI0E04356p [Yarrowia lipolytica CLIB122]Q6C725.1 RecName: Full=Antagonist of mitotic exit network protein 1 [Yarrowia lipolytica CLIB122]AOW04939.1 hypothetical protein YALI1_E05285g [Yarrowia lipolytica]KAB8286235.1 antagonist of mitotic exit network protein 1 [Yarrowia lipolytica]KAE8171559.1 antagonist of mitotic exit network protein 1 [Yarrowia lipolytica]KAJ8056516.1 antagonist of mitotic exit network protein 1 [Yarrowia lipolytica]RMI98156.1 antagonist of mitotic exit network prote|eukprot:XP_503537.1 YALI0E04356p [Yarrowia lipolytica CLIB122]